MSFISYIPHLQASLNATTLSLLVTGYFFIRRKNRTAHKICMSAALIASVMFMFFYLIYHAKVGNVPFAGEGAVRPFYFAILSSHILLAAVNVPLVVLTVFHAVFGRLGSHSRLAKWVFPLWLYVSASGLLVYLLAFHLYPR